MKKNLKSSLFDIANRLAGGEGQASAKQSPEQQLRRAVMANLLWENNAYQDGESISETIQNLIPQVPAETVFDIAIHARHEQKLRHVPLWIACNMAGLATHKHLVSKLLEQIILRPDELTEFLALYWLYGKQPLSKQVKKGLARAFLKFDAYQLAKYNRKTEIKLRDVMFLVHPKPQNPEQEQLFKQLADDTLPTPDTWEVALSSGANKKQAWTRLIQERKLGALAYLRNLRNMQKDEVDNGLILQGLTALNTKMLLPINYLSAIRINPDYEHILEPMMMKSLQDLPKLSGHTVFVVDVSGSMDARISGKSHLNRLDCAIAMAILASGLCEKISIYATAGSDSKGKHQTKQLPNVKGFAIEREILKTTYRGKNSLGGGGIFTRQCLDFIRKDLEKQKIAMPERLMVFSDSQDCDRDNTKLPEPFAKHNYIIDVSAHTHGVNYQGVWTAEISGWSEHFLRYIASLEGVNFVENDD